MDGGAVGTVYADKGESLMGLGVCNGGSLRGSRGTEPGRGWAGDGETCMSCLSRKGLVLSRGRSCCGEIYM
jgi:hypothetical protein